jgi:hypothetical protein
MFMKRIMIALFALAALVSAASAADEKSGCTNASLKGSYGLSLNGTTGGLPTAAVGVLTADGEGSFSATFTISVNGGVITGAKAVGTYAVNPDCTASATDSSDNLHYTLVIVRHGAEGFAINTDPGNVYSGAFQKQ